MILTPEEMARLWRTYDSGQQPLTNRELMALYTQAKAGLDYLEARGMLWPLAKSRTAEEVRSMGIILRTRGLLAEP